MKKRFSVVLALLSVFLLFPIYWMLNSVFQTRAELFSRPPLWFPRSFDFLSVWKIVVDNAQYFSNSLVIAFITIAVTVFVAIPAGYSLAKLNVPGKSFYLLVLLITQMFPLVMLITPMFLIFSKTGLLNNYAGTALAIGTNTIPFSILVLRSYLVSLPDSLREAAFIDGCGEMRAFVRIIIPNAMTGIMTIVVFTFLFSWGDFLFGLTMMTDNDLQPATVRLYQSIGQYGTDWRRLMTLSASLALPAMIFVVLAQRAVVNGIGNVNVNK
ncbi:carbohydrate ABC transporter permease [Cohnella caldifontis]|uniref:carbohydrate ABC transporter permease n=1 Tax=Cohnella caldifontis TaxID=3027471 RepID=UPI0023ECEEA1|nr:carbohydrate ABC transporter permease [Cohnella sp. YIM B05605]